MLKLNSKNAKIIKLLTFVPPIFGILVFTFIVKLFNNDLVATRLPYYQGLMSYYSLFYMGFTYVTNRYSIKGNKMLFFFNFNLFITYYILFYYWNGGNGYHFIIINFFYKFMHSLFVIIER